MSTKVETAHDDEQFSKPQSVRIEIELPGRGTQAIENQDCSIMNFGANRTCPLGKCECRYGLTEIRPPKDCPMRMGDKFTSPIYMKFNIVDGWPSARENEE